MCFARDDAYFSRILNGFLRPRATDPSKTQGKLTFHEKGAVLGDPNVQKTQ